MGSRLWEHSCSRLGTARRCEPPPAPRVPTSEERGGAAPLTGRGPRGRPKERMLLADLGSAGTAGHAVSTVAQAVLRYIRPRKNICGRRRFAPAKPGDGTVALEARRDENATDARPRRARPPAGKDICPMPAGGRAVGHRCHQALAGLARCAGWCERAARQRCVRYTSEPPARGPTAPHGCSGGRWNQPPEP